MLTPRIRTALVALAASASLGACTSMGPYGGVGVGVGTQYGNGGYGGYGGYGYDPYYGGYYNSGYGSAYGYNPYGWYDGYYYPGAGYWVYDPRGNPSPITDRQRSYWGNVLKKMREARGIDATAQAKPNFSGFRQRGLVPVESIKGIDAGAAATATADQRSLRQISEARRQARSERQQAQAAQRETRSERVEARRVDVQERREARQSRRSPRN